MRYTEGWVEFLDKRVGKGVADSLNGGGGGAALWAQSDRDGRASAGTSIGAAGGRSAKRNFFADDLWSLT